MRKKKGEILVAIGILAFWILVSTNLMDLSMCLYMVLLTAISITTVVGMLLTGWIGGRR